MLITGLIISLIFNILLLIAAFFGYVRSAEHESRCNVYHEMWTKWEHEYWMVRNLPQNKNLKISWIADGEILCKVVDDEQQPN